MAKLEIGSLVSIDVPDNDKEVIGVSSSGGADSAILLYILSKYLKNKIHVFTFSNKLKLHGTVLPSSQIVKKCVELNENYNLVHHILYEENFVRDTFLDTLVEKVDLGMVSRIYTGTTAIPPFEDLVKFSSGLDHETLIQRRYGKDDRPLYTYDKKLYHPFTHIHKKHIKELYQHFGVIDDLFPLTRSCESTTISIGHCGECWWCQERQWAFEK